MTRVTETDLSKLSTICSSICYHLTAHLASVAGGLNVTLPPEVGQIYNLATQLPEVGTQDWLKLIPGAAKAGGAGGAAAKGAGGKHSRIKWDAALEADLVKLVDDEEYRKEKLGKEGTRGGSLNWAALARHFNYSSAQPFKAKYAELKGQPLPEKPKKQMQEEGPEGEKPAKKGKAATEPAAPPASAKKPAAAAAAAAETPGVEWSKKQSDELVKLVEDEDLRKSVLGKKKLKWRRIGEHFKQKSKACRKQYQKATGREPPEDED